jgi:chromosome segregation ATPase
MPGLLYRSRKALGDVDDILDAKMETLDQLVRHSETMSSRLMEKDAQINSLQADLNLLNLQLKKESTSKQTIQERLGYLKTELEEEKKSRMEASQLVVSLISTQDEQGRRLEELQNQLADAQQASDEENEEVLEDVSEAQILEAPVAVDVTDASDKDSNLVFDPCEKVKPVPDESPEKDKNFAQASDSSES